MHGCRAFVQVLSAGWLAGWLGWNCAWEMGLLESSALRLHGEMGSLRYAQLTSYTPARQRTAKFEWQPTSPVLQVLYAL